MSRRRFFLLVHRINGLALTGFLVVVSLTGSALAFRLPLERFFSPELFELPAHPAEARRVDPLQIRQTIAQAFPETSADVVDLSTFHEAPLEFQLSPSSPSGATDDDVFADPFTGRILGSRHYGDLRQGWRNVVPFIDRLHEELALGNFGSICLGLVALLWTLDCFVGLYLSFPASHRSVEQSLVKRTAAWPKRFRPSLLVRWTTGSFRRLYDVHRASGVWLWFMLLLFAWTGVAFNLPSVYTTTMRIFGGSPQTTNTVFSPCLPTVSQKRPDWQIGLATARREMQAEAQRHHFRVLSERFLSYDGGSCKWTYRVRSTLDVDQIGNTQLVWQSNNSKVYFSSPIGRGQADLFTTWIEAIHEAQVGGRGIQMLVCLTGFATTFLAVTGVLLFIRKTRHSSRQLQAVHHTAKPNSELRSTSLRET